MARKQSDYLAALLAADEAGPGEGGPDRRDPPAGTAEAQARPSDRAPDRVRGTTLLGRESALARLASGEVRQVTQVLLDPARVRVWPGNARSYRHLSEASCRELIDSILAEGGQKVPAVVRRVEGDPDHEYEVIAGTRRHWSITWLRANHYPDMQFLAQVAQLDDEAAFRLADLENRARADVSDLERAWNYRLALASHYGNHQTRMAERLKLSKGWLSKMLKIATLPHEVVGSFASPAELALKPAYALAQLLDHPDAQPAILATAERLAREQRARRDDGQPPIPASEVMRRFQDAPRRVAGLDYREPLRQFDHHGRPLVSVRSANRQGVTLRLHAGSGADLDETLRVVRQALEALEAQGQGLKR
ncbi:ParB/RepB/Spo0J family partition protein [Sphingomonas abaci]|uniref:ParB family chromosome partitioning protein n=1 Tax=Sphingomonas abaci TaxID=237611 RepID=A0A7W7AMF6_9SPHN|nr:ParB/RepB/Spo0J family partition protein [Sphingomonas abaci]MBB4619791.1 ParB family chromosome partitioning protein [Sphingomonas abaci]